MRKKLLMVVCVGALAIAGAGCLPAPPPASTTPVQSVSFTPPSGDFGTVTPGLTETIMFTITATGSQPFALTPSTTGTPFRAVAWTCTQHTPPRSSCKVMVSAKGPASVPGTRSTGELVIGGTFRLRLVVTTQ